MRYYVVSDLHSFYTETIRALKDAGYFEEKKEHKLIICGDFFDRGKEAIKMQDFILDLIEKNEVILIRGNHEDLAMTLLREWDCGAYSQYHHDQNGTIDTVKQLTGYDTIDSSNQQMVKYLFYDSPYIKKIIPKTQNYFETKKYIFVHGWIPCSQIYVNKYAFRYEKDVDYKDASYEDWSYARWYNGMIAANDGVTIEGKTIVCGHYNCSFGHSRYEHKGSEFGIDSINTPYYGKGIIAIDANTVLSHRVNCIVIDD